MTDGGPEATDENSAITSNTTNGSVSLYDNATVNDGEEVPRWLHYDPITSKYTFTMSRFDWQSIPEALKMNQKETVGSWSWRAFNKATASLASRVYTVLAKYFQSGLSPIFRRKVCSSFSSRLPYMEKKYRYFRNLSSNGNLSPDLSNTVKKLSTFEVRSLSF